MLLTFAYKLQTQNLHRSIHQEVSQSSDMGGAQAVENDATPYAAEIKQNLLTLQKLLMCLQMLALVRALLHKFLFGSLNVTFLLGIGPYVEVALYHEPSRHYW